MTIEPDASFAPLRAWLMGVTGLADVVFAHGGGDEPSGTYGVLTLLNDGPNGNPENRKLVETDIGGTDKPFTESPQRPWFWTWQIDVYGQGGRNLLQKVDLGKQIPSVHADLLPYRIYETSLIRNLPEQSDNAFHERANLDITLHALRTDGMAVDAAETSEGVSIIN